MKNLKSLLMAAALITAPALMAQDAATAQTPEQTDSLSRAAATVMAQAINGSLQNIESLGVKIDRTIFINNIIKALDGKETGFDAQQANTYIDSYVQKLHPSAPDTVSVASQQEFIKKMAATEGAVTTPSGLVFIVQVEGEGGTPGDKDLVSVNYVGKLSDGTVFDQTDGTPVQFNVDKVVAGFSEGLKMMRPGGTYRIILPYNLAYGEKGIPGVIPGYSALDFIVTLDGITPVQ